MSSDERLLPTVNRLTGAEVLRVMAPDGKRMLMPLNALLDAAEGRFATNAKETALLKQAWEAINVNMGRIAALEKTVADLPTQDADADMLQALDAMVKRISEFFTVLESLTVRVATLENKPTVSTAGLATQSSVNVIASQQSVTNADIAALRTDFAKLTDRVATLEDAARPKPKDK